MKKWLLVWAVALTAGIVSFEQASKQRWRRAWLGGSTGVLHGWILAEHAEPDGWALRILAVEPVTSDLREPESFAIYSQVGELRLHYPPRWGRRISWLSLYVFELWDHVEHDSWVDVSGEGAIPEFDQFTARLTECLRPVAESQELRDQAAMGENRVKSWLAEPRQAVTGRRFAIEESRADWLLLARGLGLALPLTLGIVGVVWLPGVVIRRYDAR